MSTTNKSIDPAAEIYPIQEFLFAIKGAPGAIYARNEEADRLQSEKIGACQLKPGQRVCGNTYFNTLYLEYWRTYADIGRIGFEVHFHGKISVGLLESTLMMN